MTSIEITLGYLVPLAIGLLLLATPAMSRGGTFFAVTVPSGFPSTDLGRAIARRYRVGVLLVLAVTLALITPLWWLLEGRMATIVPYMVGNLGVVAGGIAVFVHCRNSAMKFSQDQSAAREASLAPADRLSDVVPQPWILHLVPYLLMTASIIWIALSDVDAGVGARFASPLILLASLGFIHLCMLLGLLIRRLPGHQSRVRSINELLLWLMMIMAALGSWNSLAVVFGPQWVNGPPGVTVNIAAVLAIVLLPVWMLVTGRFAQTGEAAPGDRSPDRSWKLGLFYYNPDDPALWLEKRFGVGYTLNFARPAAWVLIGLVIAGTAALVVVAAAG